MQLQNTDDDRTALWEDLPQIFRTILDYSICICLLVLLAVFPFYNEEGYDHIGTDKSTFFRKFGVIAGKGLGVILGLYLLAAYWLPGCSCYPQSARRRVCSGDFQKMGRWKNAYMAGGFGGSLCPDL